VAARADSIGGEPFVHEPTNIEGSRNVEEARRVTFVD